MDLWTRITEFFSCGLLALPIVLGLGTGSFEVFAATLGLMQILLVLVVSGSPPVAPNDDRSTPPDDNRG